MNKRSRFTLTLALFCLGASAGAQQLPAAAPSGTAPPCEVSTDPSYGLTPQNPIRVGGGVGAMAPRSQQFASNLRGPAGERVQLTGGVRSSFEMLPIGPTIVDSYPVIWDGHPEPLLLYIDGYHYSRPMAPVGFTCSPAFGVPPPVVNAVVTSTNLAALAIEQGASREFAPIPLNADGAPRVDALDTFRLLALLSRAGTAAGAPLDPLRPPTRGGTAIIAYPQECNGRTVVATTIEIQPQEGPAVPRTGPYLDDASIGTVLPRVTVPPGTLVAISGEPELRATDTVRITYDGPPCGASQTVDLPVTGLPGQFTANPQPLLPAGHPPLREPVLLQALIDLDGRVQKAVFVGGPDDLAAAASAAVANWRAVPATINGAPVVSPAMLAISFDPERK